jgi:hypothetical protein
VNCQICKTPVRKMAGDESKPDRLACWTHVTGFHQCPGSRSEYDLATPDFKELAQEQETESELVLESNGSGI